MRLYGPHFCFIRREYNSRDILVEEVYMAYAGLDVGTSGCKILVYDLKGNVLFEASRKYKELGEGGIREIDPSEILLHIKSVLREVGENCPEKIEAMAVTSLGESVVCLDENDQSLCNSMVVGDQRGIEEVKRLIDAVGREKILDITGLPPSEMYGLPKYMWINDNTDAIKNAKAILYYEDFVGYTLTGIRKVSYSSASRSMAFDIEKKQWSEELMSYAGIKVSQMSEPADAGTVIGTIKADVAEELKLNPGMKVVVGGHDQSCAALGSGLNRLDVGECGMGTCEFMFMMLPKAQKTTYMIEKDLTCVPYVLPDKYLTSTMLTTCGILKNWSIDTVLKGIKMECEANGKDFFQYVDSLINGKETDVLMLPQFGSSGNPDINYDVLGTITGLNVHTKAEEIYQAILECMAFQMLLGYESTKEIGANISKIICTGGGAKSKVTLQMRADIFNLDVATINSEESGTLGCAILAATGSGAYESIQDAIDNMVQIKDVYHPNKERQPYYQKKYQKFKELYDKMHLFK